MASENSSDTSSNADSASNVLSPVNPTPVPLGVDCVDLAVEDGDESLTLSAKIGALNCLVFDTPHSPFWVTQGTRNNEGGDLASAGDRYNFLSYENWDCTLVPDDPFLPSCRKHDMAYATLQSLVGSSSANIRDSLWNPRNKHLADITFSSDLKRDADRWTDPLTSCQSILPAVLTVVGGPAAVGAYISCKAYKGKPGTIARAQAYFWGVKYGNSKFLHQGWSLVVSSADKAHAEQYPWFVEYDSP